MRTAIEYKSAEQLQRIRTAALIVNDIHEALHEAARPGITTGELDELAGEVLRAAGARSNFLGYYDYPAHTCISVNEEIVHGIPGERVLEAGDIVSFDCGAVKDGWHGDSCFTMVMPGGTQEDEARRTFLSAVAEQAMWAGVAAMATGRRVGDIGAAIDDYLTAHAPDVDIVLDYTGHGIGSSMHQAPDVLNYRSRGRSPRLKDGMVLCIEPMVTDGSQANHTLDDGWTVITDDGSDACHWECEVARHSGGIWVLNHRDGGLSALASYGIEPVPLP